MRRRAVSDAEGAQELIDEGGDDPEMREEIRVARERTASSASARST